MSEDVVAGPVGERRQASTADTGTALTTTASFTSFFRGTDWIRIVPRNAVTAVVVKYVLNPWLIVFKTTDALAAIANMTEASEALQDNDTSTSLSLNSLGAFAAGDALFVGSYIPFRGARVIIGNTNTGAASTLTVKYRKNDDTWADASATDGTDVAGGDVITMGQTGNVYWTMPTDWKPDSIEHIQSLVGTWLVSDMDTTAGALVLPRRETLPPYIIDPKIYWTRWEVSTVLDSSVTITGMQSMNRSTTYDALDINLGWEQRIRRGLGGFGCIEHLTDAGTANLIISCGVLGVSGKFVD